jgi:hypothetical protein
MAEIFCVCETWPENVVIVWQSLYFIEFLLIVNVPHTGY